MRFPQLSREENVDRREEKKKREEEGRRESEKRRKGRRGRGRWREEAVASATIAKDSCSGNNDDNRAAVATVTIGALPRFLFFTPTSNARKAKFMSRIPKGLGFLKLKRV